MNLLSRAVKIKYLLLVTVSVFVIFGNLLFIQHMQHIKMDNSRIIHFIGKEQSILNSICNHWVSLNFDESKRSQISLDFEELQKLNNGLIYGDAGLGMNAMENDAVKNELLDLKLIFEKFKDNIENAKLNDPRGKEAIVASLIQIENRLQKIEDQCYKDTQHKYLIIYRLQLFLVFLKVAVFLFVIFYNYLPLEKKLHNTIRQLEQKEYNLRSLINSTQESIYYLSKEGKLLYFNKLARESLMAYLGREVKVGDSVEQLLFAGMEDRFYDSFYKALNAQANEWEWQVMVGGKLVWYYVGFFPVWNEKSEVMGVSFITSDIQEKKQAALKNEAYVAELEKIAWRQSHLLRAPVANVIGLSKLLLRNPERNISSETQHLLGMIVLESEKMDQEIHKIVQHSSHLCTKADLV